ncbi:MAG: hypothetical protein LBQ98_05390 [Nitrososphaerota archaeon]|jgi:transposase|nr:hypothetical protein [Nitrososphaerota archaeon]
MHNTDINAIKLRINKITPTLNEYQRRIYLAAEAKALGHGGITLISKLSGISRQTLTNGIKELDNPNPTPPKPGKSRKKGGGRKSTATNNPKIIADLTELLQPHTKGDPTNLLLWTNKSLRNLSKALAQKGHTANKDTIRHMLKELGYGLQADKNSNVKPSHPARDI